MLSGKQSCARLRCRHSRDCDSQSLSVLLLTASSGRLVGWSIPFPLSPLYRCLHLLSIESEQAAISDFERACPESLFTRTASWLASLRSRVVPVLYIYMTVLNEKGFLHTNLQLYLNLYLVNVWVVSCRPTWLWSWKAPSKFL